MRSEAAGRRAAPAQVGRQRQLHPAFTETDHPIAVNA